MSPPARRPQQGQILVLFALAALALISMLGLVLDGGSTYAQRRTQQIGADMAALAGANAWLLDTGDNASKAAAADAAARAVASQNGYTDGSPDTVVKVTPAIYGAGETVTVDIGAPHRNAFGSIIGLSSWQVAVTATAVVGPGGQPRGVAPFIFHEDVFVDGTGEILPEYGNPAHPFVFGETEIHAGDIPEGPDDLAWTVMGYPDNLNTDDVRDIIRGIDQVSRPIEINDYIGQHNNGTHNDLFDEVHDYLRGLDLTTPIVDGFGRFQGWAIFHVTDASKHDKTVTGYFTTGFSENLDVCMDTTDCPVAYGGVKVLKLIN
jgi:Flp pilus assembly protein TadG